MVTAAVGRNSTKDFWRLWLWTCIPHGAVANFLFLKLHLGIDNLLNKPFWEFADSIKHNVIHSLLSSESESVSLSSTPTLSWTTLIWSKNDSDWQTKDVQQILSSSYILKWKDKYVWRYYMSHCSKKFKRWDIWILVWPMSTTHLFCLPPHRPSFLGSYSKQSLQIYQSMTINKRLIELGTKAQYTDYLTKFLCLWSTEPQPKKIKRKREKEKKATGPAEVQHEQQQRRSRLELPKTRVVNRHGMTMKRIWCASVCIEMVCLCALYKWMKAESNV